MTRSCGTFALMTFLTLAAAPGVQIAWGAGDKAKPVQEQLQDLDASLKKAFEQVSEQIKALQRDLQSAKEDRADVHKKLQEVSARITTLDRALADLKRDLESGVRKPAPEVVTPPPVERATLEDIRARLTLIEQALTRPPSRTALYPPTAVESAEPRGDQLKQIREELERLDRTTRHGLDRLREDFTALRREVKDCREERTDVQLKLQALLATINGLQPQLSDIRGELKAVQVPRTSTVSLYPPAVDRVALDDIRAKLSRIEQDLTRPAPRPTAIALYPLAGERGTGRLLLRNNYREALEFVVNGRSYTVAAGTTLPLEGFPAGVFSYEVISPTWGLRGSNTTTLAPRETFTISAQ